MSIQHEPAEEPVTEKLVADYLRAHPDFFNHHPALLAALEIPHPTGAAVSLIERQVSVLRDQHRDVKRRFNELLEAARENEHLNQRLHRLTLALWDAGDLPALLEALARRLRQEFKPDALAIRLWDLPAAAVHAPDTALVAADDPGVEAFHNCLEAGRPLCGHLKRGQLEFLFGDDATTVASAVVLPLKAGRTYGLAGIASHDPHRFHPAMDTLLLRHLGELVGHAIHHHHRG